MEGNAAPPLRAEGIIYPASESLASAVSNLIPKFLKDGDYKGTPYGIPWTTSTRALYYNKKIFSRPASRRRPTTWAQLKTDAAKIKAKGNIGYGMPLGPEEAQAESLLWFLGDGGGYVNSSGEVRHQQPAEHRHAELHEAVRGLRRHRAQPGRHRPHDVWADFAQGKMGMVLGSPASSRSSSRSMLHPPTTARPTPRQERPADRHARRPRRHRRVQGRWAPATRPRSRSSWTSPTRTSGSCSSTTSTTCCRPPDAADHDGEEPAVRRVP